MSYSNLCSKVFHPMMKVSSSVYSRIFENWSVSTTDCLQLIACTVGIDHFGNIKTCKPPVTVNYCHYWIWQGSDVDLQDCSSIVSTVGEIQWFGILRAVDPCRRGTMWLNKSLVLSCEITCQKFGDSLCVGIRPMKSWTWKLVSSL